jgi:hypothetical protein
MERIFLIFPQAGVENRPAARPGVGQSRGRRLAGRAMLPVARLGRFQQVIVIFYKICQFPAGTGSISNRAFSD